jgi:hypothetical protein
MNIFIKILIGLIAIVALGWGALYFLIYRHTGYKIRDSKVHFIKWDEGNGFQEQIVDADIESFKPISGNRDLYAKDKTHVFYLARIIVGADPETFELIKSPKNVQSDVYAKDAKHVYKYGKAIELADPKTFKLLDYGYSQDSQTVFFDEKPIKEADPSTFYVKSFEEYVAFGMDSSHVYDYGKIVVGADPKTFNGKPTRN